MDGQTKFSESPGADLSSGQHDQVTTFHERDRDRFAGERRESLPLLSQDRSGRGDGLLGLLVLTQRGAGEALRRLPGVGVVELDLDGRSDLGQPGMDGFLKPLVTDQVLACGGDGLEIRLRVGLSHAARLQGRDEVRVQPRRDRLVVAAAPMQHRSDVQGEQDVELIAVGGGDHPLRATLDGRAGV